MLPQQQYGLIDVASRWKTRPRPDVSGAGSALSENALRTPPSAYLVDLRGSREPERGELRREHARVCGFPGVQALAHGAVGVEGPQPRALRAREPERPRGVFLVQPEQHRARGGRAKRTAHAGEMPAAKPRRRRIEREAGTDHHFIARRDRRHQLLAARFEFFGHGKRGRDHDCARMQLRVMVIVELERVRRRAVHERGIRGAQRPLSITPDGRFRFAAARARPFEERARPGRRVAVDTAAERVEQRAAHDFACALGELVVLEL